MELIVGRVEEMDDECTATPAHLSLWLDKNWDIVRAINTLINAQPNARMLYHTWADFSAFEGSNAAVVEIEPAGKNKLKLAIWDIEGERHTELVQVK